MIYVEPFDDEDDEWAKRGERAPETESRQADRGVVLNRGAWVDVPAKTTPWAGTRRIN